MKTNLKKKQKKKQWIYSEGYFVYPEPFVFFSKLNFQASAYA